MCCGQEETTLKTILRVLLLYRDILKFGPQTAKIEFLYNSPSSVNAALRMLAGLRKQRSVNTSLPNFARQ